ncbi:hypothetical protein LXA43DRAFT_878433 [Ganoderma leucocontextum]|nr:hypothetical protein LXA43DRAFT_878433 [Ganoderma leucocontextum]
MSNKEPTRAQLSSRLTYQSRTPAFLLRIQNGLGGGGREDDDDDEFEYDGSGRPPIPKRPAIPERPDDEPGSANEDDLDEKPQIVVLREGKHLSERDVENEKRKAKGLPPLPDPAEASVTKKESAKGSTSAEPKAPKQQGLSFGASVKPKGAKRKAVGDGRDDAEKPESTVKPTKKKTKKQDKKLLSFDEDA